MFTGIVEEIGTVLNWQQGPTICKLTIRCELVLEDIKPGDSIAVNGICLTAAQLGEHSFTADILVESLTTTSLADLQRGSSVNLERALQIGGRLGGHWVTGHIDDVGTIINIVQERNSIWYTIKVPDHLMNYLVSKGSLAIDGTSLTIAKLVDDLVTVCVIPHTASQTVLGIKQRGERVNIEVDILGKYVAKMLKKDEGESSGLTKDKLTQLGFS